MRKRLLFLILMVFAGTLILHSQEPKIILTPKSGPEPRINGTKIFGVRPIYNTCNRKKANEI